MRFDIQREVERVLAHQRLDALGVARFERFDDAHVVFDRTRRAVALRDRHAPDRDEKGKVV